MSILRLWLASVVAYLPSLGLCGSKNPKDFHNSKRAVPLGAGSFDWHLAQQRERMRPTLVMFHVNWCKVCHRTFPIFANASETVHELDIPMDFAHADCTSEKTLCTRFNVKGYPSIMLFGTVEGEEPRNYKGMRNEQSFVKYAERMTQPAVQHFPNAADFAQRLHNETLVGFVALEDPKKPPQGLMEAAGTWQDRHTFAFARRIKDLLPEGSPTPPEGTTLAAVSASQQQWPGRDNTTKAKPAVVFFKGDLQEKTAVSEWIGKNRFPGIWILNESNFYEFTHGARHAAMVAIDPAAVSEEVEAQLLRASKDLKGSFVFGVIDGVAWADELADFNVHRAGLPRVLITEGDMSTWIEDHEALRADHLVEDLKAFHAGSSLLRQTRTTWGKLWFYKREAWRLLQRIAAYGMRGPRQAIVVSLGFCGASAAMLLSLKLLGALLQVIVQDPEELPEGMVRAPFDKPKQQ